MGQPVGCRAVVPSPWEESCSNRRRRVGCSVSNTPGHSGLRCDRVCTRAIEGSLDASSLTFPRRGKKRRRPRGNHNLFPAGLGAWLTLVDDAVSPSIVRWWSVELPGVPWPTAGVVAEDE